MNQNENHYGIPTDPYGQPPMNPNIQPPMGDYDRPGMNPYVYPQGSFYERRIRETGSKRDMIYSGVFFLLSLLCINFFFYGGCGIAFAIAAMGLFTGGLLYLLPYRRGGGAYMAFCALSYLLSAFTMVLTDSSMGAFLSISTMLVLSGITLMELMSLGRRKKGTIRCMADWFQTVFSLPFGNMGAAFYALFRKKGEDGSVEKRKINTVIIGILCAIPVLLMVIPLLMGADGAFEELMDRISVEYFTELPVTVIFGVGLFILFFGQHFATRFEKKEEPCCEKTGGGVDTAFMVTFLSVICLVYVLYLVSQLAYFFQAFAGLLPKDYTVAQYARRGFFEMTTVCVINLGLLLFTLLAARKKENGKEPVFIRILAVFLTLFSLVLIATAMSKMNLYIHSFGMTYLRLITSVFMIFLCVVFCTMGLWIFLRKLPYMRVAVVTAVILVLGLSFADPARVVADYNVNAYQTGKLESIDMSELKRLGSHAVVPYAWELREDSNKEVSQQAWRILYEHGQDFDFFKGEGDEYSYDWRGFNVSSYKAYQIILENREEIWSQADKLGYTEYDWWD